MDSNYFMLGNSEKGKLVNIVRILFGAVCMAVAVYWLIFNIKGTESSGSIWITILFLTGFGFYLIWAGLGKADRFIDIRDDKIMLKKNIFLPPVELTANDTELIEIYSLKVNFVMCSGKTILLRFGTNYNESNEKITEAITVYCTKNNIILKEISEEV